MLLHSMLSFPGNADLLFGVSMFDPATFLGLPCLFALIALAASALPVRAASGAIGSASSPHEMSRGPPAPE